MIGLNIIRELINKEIRIQYNINNKLEFIIGKFESYDCNGILIRKRNYTCDNNKPGKIVYIPTKYILTISEH